MRGVGLGVGEASLAQLQMLRQLPNCMLALMVEAPGTNSVKPWTVPEIHPVHSALSTLYRWPHNGYFGHTWAIGLQLLSISEELCWPHYLIKLIITHIQLVLFISL